MVTSIQTFDGLALQRWYLLSDEHGTAEEDTDTVVYGTFERAEADETYTGYPVMVNPLNLVLAPMSLSEEEARELEDILEHPRAFPTVPVEGLPRGDRSRLSRRTP